MREGVITADQRFGIHAFKHRGVTDTTGSRKGKQEGSGHKSKRMPDTYNHSVPLVDAAVIPAKNGK